MLRSTMRKGTQGLSQFIERLQNIKKEDRQKFKSSQIDPMSPQLEKMQFLLMPLTRISMVIKRK